MWRGLPDLLNVRSRGFPPEAKLRDLFDDDHTLESWKAKARRILLDLDSRVDSSLYQARTWGRELWERFTAFMDRFHVAGWRRWVLVEPASEGFSLGTGGPSF